MAPRELTKSTPKVQRTIIKNMKPKSSPITTIEKSLKTKIMEKTPLKVKNSFVGRQRTKTVPNMNTPKPKENKPLPERVPKSAKKANWKKRPKPAHSGVPVPEKMKKLFSKHMEDNDCSF